MCKKRNRELRRRFWKLLPAVVMPIIILPRTASADNWLNPNGGSWSTGSNWSENGPPTNYSSDDEVFSLGSQSGYTVTGVNNAYYIIVQGDQPTLNFSGYVQEGGYYEGPGAVTVTSNPGQTSSLTLLNGTLNPYDSIMIGGSGGTCTLSTNSFTINCYMGGASFGGSAGSVTNYNQVGGSLISYAGYVVFGAGAGSVNVSIAGGSAYSTYGDVIFGEAGTTTANLNLTSVYSTQGNVEIGTGAATAVVTATSTTFLAANNVFGVGVPVGLFYGSSPAAGGGTGTLIASNSAVVGGYFWVGASQGNGTLRASGCTLESLESFRVGDHGTGVVALSNGSTMSLQYTQNYIGANGGNGTLTLSGVGTSCTVHTDYDQAAEIYIGSDGNSNGVGLVELDHGATLTVSNSSGYGVGSVIPGLLNLSSTGTLEVLSGSSVTAGSLVEAQGATLQIGLDGPVSADDGQLNLTTATVAGTLDIVLENGFEPVYGQQFYLFPFTKITGQFSTIDLPAGYPWDTSDLYAQGIISVGPVPEPGGIVCLVVLGASSLRRRRRAFRPFLRQ